MKRRLISAVTVMSLAALAAGCNGQTDGDNTASETPATSASGNGTSLGTSTIEAPNGAQVSESLFRYYALNAAQKPVENLTEEERAAILDYLATMQLLTNAAVERGLANERAIAVQLEIQRQQILAQNMVRRYAEENPPTQEELEAEYQSSTSEFDAVEHKARHILVETREEAEALITELDNGADFAELAEEHSIDPGASNGGDLGWFSADAMVAPFSEAVANLEVGRFTAQPVETQFGWHVILVEERRTTEPPGLDAVREEISNRVTQRKVEDFIESLQN